MGAQQYLTDQEEEKMVCWIAEVVLKVREVPLYLRKA